MSDTEIIHMSSIVGAKDGKPHVLFEWGDQKGELTPSEARQHALSVLETADAAESDAFIVDWLRSTGKFENAQIAKVLEDFRNYRLRQLEE